MHQRRVLSSVLLTLFLAFGVASPAMACEPLPEPPLAQAVENSGVVGVVERLTVASNPFPWGTSISVVTTIWGGIRAERWKVSNLRFNECPASEPQAVGNLEYDFRGAEADWAGTRSSMNSSEPLTSAEVSIVEAEFGPGETFTVGSVDRVMANIRVWGFELTVMAVVLVTGTVALIRRRIRKRYDRTLF